MSTVQLCILAGGGLSSKSFSTDVINTSFSTGIRSASITIVTNGTTSGGFVTNPENWYAPTTAGIGSSFWCKMTTSNLNLVNVGGSLAAGTWMQLSSNQNATFANDGIGAEGTGNFAIQFSTDSAGSVITGTISGWIDVGYTA